MVEGAVGKAQAGLPRREADAAAESGVTVVICDDDAEVRQMLLEYCERLCRRLDIRLTLRVFCDGDELVDDFPRDADVLLLDVEMPLLDGMSAAREIRTLSPSVVIVFITSFEQYAIPGYEVGAYRYLLKPIDYERFSLALGSVFERIRDEASERLRVRIKGGFATLPLAQVVSISTGGNHLVQIRLSPGAAGHDAGVGAEAIRAYQSLASLERLLPSSFFRCNESCIVNLRHVARLRQGEVVLDDSDVVPLSKRRRKGFRDAYLRQAADLLLAPASSLKDSVGRRP